MEPRFALLFLFTSCVWFSSVIAKDTRFNDNAGIQQREDFDAVAYLEKAGYLDDIDTGNHRFHATDNIKQALREFQEYYSLPVTGSLDTVTTKLMKQPRCGVPDVIKPSQRRHQLNNKGDVDPPSAYISSGLKWNKNELTYKINSFTNDLPIDQQRQAISRSFLRWSQVTPLKFSSSQGNVDIDISFGRKAHGDTRPFDGPSGTLAHSWFPGYLQINGDIHFDDDELWTQGTEKGVNLEQVATHEVGHALGLGHSKNLDAIMFASNLGYKGAHFSLHNDDVKGIQTIYGPPGDASAKAETTRGPRTTYPPRTTPLPTRAECQMTFDAIEQVHDGEIYAFAGSSIYNIMTKGPIKLGNISRIYRRAPSSPSAVVYDRYKGKLYMFKGSQYWRFTRYTLDASYPKTLPKDFHNVDAAIQRDNHGYLVLFQGNNLTIWNENVSTGYPRQIDSFYPGGPKSVDSAFVGSNGYLYILSGTKYWKYWLNRFSHESLFPGFPLDNRPFWYGCGKNHHPENLFGYPGK